MSTKTNEQVIETIRTDPAAVAELERITSVKLSDLIRLGSQYTEQAYNWGQGEKACALSAAAVVAKATGWIK